MKSLQCIPLLTALLLAFPDKTLAASADSSRIQTDSNNPRYWQYKGEPVALLGGSDDDNLFQWEEQALERQLDLLQSVGGNYLRNTMSARDEGNLQPFYQQADGRYDLDRWNPEYWERLERFLTMTGEREIIVQIELWDPWDTYGEAWERNAWNPANNINFTPENSRLETAYSPPQYRGGMSYGKPHDFFMTPPALSHDQVVLEYQARFVTRLLESSLRHGHVLYCITNEIHPQYSPEWGWHWARFIRERAATAGLPVFISEMFWIFDFQAEQHRASLDRPEIYDFFEASQNSAMRDPDMNWRNLQFVYDRLEANPRPINNTKIYGAGAGPVWAGSERDAVERFWRNLIGGAASSRFHRPLAGIGLSEIAQRHLRSARLLLEQWDLFRSKPDGAHRLLDQRDPNEVYLSSIAGEQYALYFPDGGSVALDLREVPGRFVLNWLDVDASRWTGRRETDGGAHLLLEPPSNGHWIALLTRAPDQAQFSPTEHLQPFRDNPHYLAWGSTPVFLLGAAGYHSWTPISRPGAIDFEAQLDRLAGVIEEIGSPHLRGFVRCLPYDPMNHIHDGDVQRVLQPWVQLEDKRYDLERFATEWEERLRHFLDAALQRGIMVSLEVWDDWSVTRGPGGAYDPGQGAGWNAHPFNPLNNANYDEKVFPVGTSVCDAPFYSTIPSRANIELVLDLQKRYVDHLLDLSAHYPNVLFNISNESRAHLDWSRFWADYLRERLPPERLLGDMPSTNRRDGGGECEHAFNPMSLSTDPRYDFVDVAQGVSGHEFKTPREQALGGGRRMREYRQAMHAQGTPRPLIVSKDYTRSPEGGDMILWSRFAGGAAAARFHRLGRQHPESVSQFQHDAVLRLGRFIAQIPFWKMRPAPDLILSLPGGAGANVLAEPNGQTVLQLIGGQQGNTLSIRLPEGLWEAAWLNPEEDRELARMTVNATGGTATLELPGQTEHRILHLKPR